MRDVGFPVAFLVRFLFLGGVGTGFGVGGFFLCWFFGFFFLVGVGLFIVQSKLQLYSFYQAI